MIFLQGSKECDAFSDYFFARLDIRLLFKDAAVVPLYKVKGDSRDPSEYRPISLSHILAKSLEEGVLIEIDANLRSIIESQLSTKLD